MAVTIFQKGEEVLASARFRTPKNASPPSELFDPTVVEFRVLDPEKTTTVYTYGVNPEVERDSVGFYFIKFPLTQDGTYHWRWTGSGTSGGGVAVGQFDSRQEPNF